MGDKQQRIGTLTFHFAHNYGAMLQAYALPTALRKLGYNCEVIDYRFPYIDCWSRIERWKDLFSRHGLIGGSLRYIKRLATGYYLRDDMHVKFDRFERKIISHSPKIYFDKTELKNLPYDAILFGSDQIWNSEITNGVAEEYIGGFPCLPGTRKIAYAASCGTSDFRPESREIYEQYLRDFHAIGVREVGFQKTLCSRGFQAECVLDPTLLLTSEDWKELLLPQNPAGRDKYLLVYAFDEDKVLYDLARHYAEVNGLQIVVLAYKKEEAMYGMQVLTDCGPLEFLTLFASAEHTLTTSFHGTVFSILFHKEFHCVPHPIFRERTDSLLQMLNLTDHIVEELTELQDVQTDWKAVDASLHRQRETSIGFLKQALEADRRNGNDEDSI